MFFSAQAMSEGHEHHHDETEMEEEKQKILKCLAGVFGLYGFFLFESSMVIMRKRKAKKVRIVTKTQ